MHAATRIAYAYASALSVVGNMWYDVQKYLSRSHVRHEFRQMCCRYHICLDTWPRQNCYTALGTTDFHLCMARVDVKCKRVSTIFKVFAATAFAERTRTRRAAL